MTFDHSVIMCVPFGKGAGLKGGLLSCAGVINPLSLLNATHKATTNH